MTGLDLGVIEDVVDESEQRVHAGLNGLYAFVLTFVELRLCEEVRHSRNAVERSANLMAQAGDYRIVRAVRQGRLARTNGFTLVSPHATSKAVPEVRAAQHEQNPQPQPHQGMRRDEADGQESLKGQHYETGGPSWANRLLVIEEDSQFLDPFPRDPGRRRASPIHDPKRWPGQCSTPPCLVAALSAVESELGCPKNVGHSQFSISVEAWRTNGHWPSPGRKTRVFSR